MKKKILPFIKKYPMSILLAIIALNLSLIAGSLRTTAKLDKKKLICLNTDEYTGKQLSRKVGKNYYMQCRKLFE